MNRNVESHFSTTPEIDIQRSTFEIPFNHRTTLNVGDLVPFYCAEVLPGDTFRITTSKVIRLQTMLNPILDNLYADFYYFYVRDILVFDKLKNLMGESDKAWLPEHTYQIPFIKTTYDNSGVKAYRSVPAGSIFDYFGWPTGVKGVEGSALPIRGYHMIWNEFFRDTTCQDPLNIYTGEADKVMNDPDASDDLTEKYPWPRKVARYHDYFSSVLPSPQRGPTVELPLGDFARVRTLSSTEIGPNIAGQYKSDSPYMNWLEWDNTNSKWILSENTNGKFAAVSANGEAARTGSNLSAGTAVYGLVPGNLAADLSNATAASINDLRTAFALQRMFEKDALYGDRYISILKGHFGVSAGDLATLRPEYLGGNRICLNVHEVVNQSEGEQEFLGNLGAYSHTSDVHEDFIKSFEQHGYVIGVMCVRYDNSFSQGLERFWSRRYREDFFWPGFSHLGNMAVKNKELYYQSHDPNDTVTGKAENEQVFGYQEYAADYRYKPNLNSAEMRPQHATSLASWHLGDYYQSLPIWSGDWLSVSKAPVDRALAVTSAVSNQIFADIFVQNIATRPMPLYSVPGLLDHF